MRAKIDSNQEVVSAQSQVWAKKKVSDDKLKQAWKINERVDNADHKKQHHSASKTSPVQQRQKHADQQISRPEQEVNAPKHYKLELNSGQE